MNRNRLEVTSLSASLSLLSCLVRRIVESTRSECATAIEEITMRGRIEAIVFNRSTEEDQRTRMSFIQMSPLLTERNETVQQTENDLNNALKRTLVNDFVETDIDKDEGMLLSLSE